MADNDSDNVCQQCKKSLIGHRFIRKESHPYCIPCYENQFSNVCQECHERISCDHKDLTYKERHWHAKCFNCSCCKKSLVDESFVTSDTIAQSQCAIQPGPDDIVCVNCYEEKFAARCDACQKTFPGGARKYEYREKRFHEECFLCSDCKGQIGNASFIPLDENNLCCVPCYEENHCKKCAECNKAIRHNGLIYKEKPWHKECFSCAKCQLLLSGQQFVSMEDRPYCIPCYGELFAKKCLNCAKPILGFRGYKFISFEDKHFHSECFNCIKCSANLVGKGFLLIENKVTCPDCS
jgi:LIM domain-containing protein 2